MKLNKYSLALILGFGMLTSCNDRLELLNPNQQTSSTFGFNPDDLEECVIADLQPHPHGRFLCSCRLHHRCMSWR